MRKRWGMVPAAVCPLKAGMGRMVDKMDGCFGGACAPGRGFLTKEEKIEMLEEYRKSLELEAKGVKERIDALKKQN